MLALLAVTLAAYHYATGEAATLPLRLVPHLQPVPLTLETIRVGAAQLPVQVNAYLTSFTHDLAGPFTRPDAAAAWVALLAVVLAGWLAVVSCLPRPAFVAGMALVIFLLGSLNADLLGIFDDTKQYFLLVVLVVLGGAASGLHMFGERLGLGWRYLLFGVLVAGLGALLFGRSQLPPADTALHLAAYATPGGALLLALLVGWLGIENLRGLLWLNTQADTPGGRFGLLPFVAASLLYLTPLALYFFNNGELLLFPGLRFDPLALLLPAALVGGLGLRRRAGTVAGRLPYAPGLRQLYPLALAGAAGALGYGLATANGPLLQAAREFTNLVFLTLGAAFLIYVLLNFAPLLRQRLAVHRVVFEPRRFPFYAMYLLGGLAAGVVLLRQDFKVLDLVRAGLYNELGDLARRQSEARPDDLSRALLTERYYAESDALDRNNARAALGRAALFRFRGQPGNELVALRRALRRAPSEKISLHLAALHQDPQDFFEAQQVLREGLRDNPGSAALAADMAQLYTRSTLTDSVAFYLNLAARRAPGTYANRTNELAFLLSQGLLAEARQRLQPAPTADEPALTSNQILLNLLEGRSAAPARRPAPAAADALAAAQSAILDEASFALLYHQALRPPARADTSLLPTLRRAAARPANEPYTDQLVFAQALLLHRAGQEQRARQLLTPLTVGDSPAAAYHQYLLGMWQLKQEQYATAAGQLARAAGNGFGAAGPAQLLVRFINSPPDSLAAFATVLRQLPDSTRRAVEKLRAQAAAGAGSRPGAWAARLTETARTKDADALEGELRQVARLGAGPLGADLYGRALVARLRQRPAEEQRLYAQIIREAPFNEPAMLAAADFYTRRQDAAAAHETLRRGLEENPASPALLEAYVLAAGRAGLFDYATAAIEQLRPQLSPAAYATLRRRLTQARAAHDAAF